MRLHHLKLVEQEMHPPDPLVDVPVPAIPSVTGQAVVDGIQPPLGGGIHAALVDAAETALRLFAGIAGPPFRIPKISCGRAAAYSSTLTVSFAVTLGYTFTSTS